MLSTEFTTELGAFIRALEAQIRQHPELRASDERDVIDHLDQAIIALVAVRMKLKRSVDQM